MITKVLRSLTLACLTAALASAIISPTPASAVKIIPLKIQSPTPGSLVALTNGTLTLNVSSPTATNILWYIYGIPSGGEPGSFLTYECLGWTSLSRSFNNVLNLPIPSDFNGGWTFDIVGCVTNSTGVEPVVWSTGLTIAGIPSVRLTCSDETLVANQKTMFTVETKSCPSNKRTTIWGWCVTAGWEPPAGTIGDFVFFDGVTEGGNSTTYIDSNPLPANICNGWWRISVSFNDDPAQNAEDVMTDVLVIGGVPQP